MAIDYQATQKVPSSQERQEIPESFLGAVKEVLEHFLDLRYLQHHPLAEQLGLASESAAEITGQWLRREVTAAIETLMPEKHVSFHSPHARGYHLIRLHYLQGRTVDEAACELGISPRQAYRDLRWGERSVAEALWARRSMSRLPEPSVAHVSSIRAEMVRLGTHLRPIDLCVLVQRALEAVTPMALERGITLPVDLPREPVTVSTDPVVARQILVGLLSCAIQQARPGPLYLALTMDDQGAVLGLQCNLETEAGGTPEVSFTIMELIDRLGWTMRQEDYEGVRFISLHTAVHGPTVLVIDDNEELVKLLKRYLTNQACRVVATTDGQMGLRMAQDLVPDVIVLDIMMPEIDGWEVLQRLRNHPRTAKVPVIVCSVINDPGLAYSLGASLVLRKPVNRRVILDALVQVGVV